MSDSSSEVARERVAALRSSYIGYRNTARAVFDLGDQAVPELLSELDKHGIEIVNVLGDLLARKVRGPAAKDAILALLDLSCVTNSPVWVDGCIQTALRMAGTEEVFPLLLARLRSAVDSGDEEWVGNLIAIAVDLIGCRERLVPELIWLGTDERAAIRYNACWPFRHIGLPYGRPAIPMLRSLSNDPESFVRDEAIVVLRSLGEEVN